MIKNENQKTGVITLGCLPIVIYFCCTQMLQNFPIFLSHLSFNFNYRNRFVRPEKYYSGVKWCSNEILGSVQSPFIVSLNSSE